jgi:hypothetical protein
MGYLERLARWRWRVLAGVVATVVVAGTVNLLWGVERESSRLVEDAERVVAECNRRELAAREQGLPFDRERDCKIAITIRKSP